MSFDPRRLRYWPVPEARQRFTRRDAAFYALSVGMGQDALDRDQLRFVDPGREDQRALPSMALVLGYPGFWLGDPATGVDVARVVHAGQSIELFGALPCEGVVVGRTRVVDLVDLGPGRGALLYSERIVADEAGRPLARLGQSHMIRGAGGFGGGSARPPAPRPVASGNPLHRVELRTREEQALLYRLNGDMNPLHADPDLAARAGFARPLLHGMCVVGLVAHALLRASCGYDPARLRSLSLRFTSPVHPGENLVVEIHRDGSFRAVAAADGRVVADFGHSRIDG